MNTAPSAPASPDPTPAAPAAPLLTAEQVAGVTAALAAALQPGSEVLIRSKVLPRLTAAVAGLGPTGKA